MDRRRDLEIELFNAAIDDDAAEIRRLLALGANPNEPTFAAILTAACNPGVAALRELIGGTNLETARDNAGRDALMWAAIQGNLAGVGMLLGPCSADARSGDGSTALMFACMHGQCEAARLLMPASDLSVVDEWGRDAATLMLRASWKVPVERKAECLALSEKIALAAGKAPPRGAPAPKARL
jgi:ankyrin repeat protein